MARLQDFQPVTPTDSDNLLVVQSTGQGLATVGSTLGAKMDKANPTGTGSLSMNRKADTTEGTNSVAVGTGNTASGAHSFAEGYSTTASGSMSHAEGRETTASGINGSHAEGYGTTASGERSHAEGAFTTASGTYSHAEGGGTIASRKAQHVFGEWNVEDLTGVDGDARGAYIEIVGKGTGTNSRSNARTLDWSGNEVLAGGLKINGNKDVLAITPDFTTVARNASATITMTKPSGILIITRARSAQVVTISYYALYLHNNAYVNFELMTNTADNTVTLTTLGSKQLQISTTAEYGIAFRLIEF